MSETQQSISEWATATFGPAGSDLSVATRANQELAEALHALATGETRKAGEEIADTMIVLARLFDRLEEPLQWDVRLEGDEAMGCASEAGANLHYAMQLLALGRAGQALGYLRSVSGWLRMAAFTLDLDLPAEINRKMAINRARQWKLDGHGHGYHVREDE